MSRSVTVGPRVEFELGRYVRLRVRDEAAGVDRRLYLHRLVALAHGELDALSDPLDVHHVDGDGWNNRPGNLEARPRDEHARHHARADP